MILGKGLIASTLSDFKNDDSVLIFASGVSNSGETREEAYKRERDLFLSVVRTNVRLIYFSTCSVFDKSLDKSRYVKHKLEMEKLLIENSNNYLLVRLPILIGRTSNPHTFFNFIRDRIMKNETLKVHRHAWRYLFDVDDLKRFLPLLLKKHSSRKEIINMAFDNGTNVINLVELFENIICIKAKVQLVNKGSKYAFNCNPFLSFLKENNISYEKEIYNYSILKKYLKT